MHKIAEIEVCEVKKPLLNARRTFIREDILDVAAEGKTRRRTKVYILSDMLVISRNGNMKDAEPYGTTIMLNAIDVEEDEIDRRTLHITHTRTSSTSSHVSISFRSPAMLTTWSTALHTAIDAHIFSLKRRKSRRASASSAKSFASDASAGLGSKTVGAALGGLLRWSYWSAGEGAGAPPPPSKGDREKRRIGEGGSRGGNSVVGGTNPDTLSTPRLTRKPSTSSMHSRSSVTSLATVWIPDNEATTCMICGTTKFSLVTRKHHCRHCGRVICWKCSRFIEVPLPAPIERPLSPGRSSAVSTVSVPQRKEVRLCTECFEDGRGEVGDESGSSGRGSLGRVSGGSLLSFDSVGAEVGARGSRGSVGEGEGG
ncbi:hypothetical protein HDV00_009508 [Rhizophlyctis rosea]|nr:hypothetical protein HDV00_009508 [Rhizophlyctis rosea]